MRVSVCKEKRERLDADFIVRVYERRYVRERRFYRG